MPILERPREVVDQRDGDHEAVGAVQQAAEAGQPGAGVLHAELALDQRFEQVAPDGPDRHDDGKASTSPSGMVGGSANASSQVPSAAPRTLPMTPSQVLFGLTIGRERVAADQLAHRERAHIREGRRQRRRTSRMPGPPGSQAVDQRQVPEQQRQVGKPEGGQRERPDASLDVLGQQRLERPDDQEDRQVAEQRLGRDKRQRQGQQPEACSSTVR